LIGQSMPVLGILDRQTNGVSRCHAKFIRTHRPARRMAQNRASPPAARGVACFANMLGGKQAQFQPTPYLDNLR
jgi:hypothetical protein